MTKTQIPTVLPLRQATDPSQAGVKAATLAALAAHGLQVPDGLVIPTGVFVRALAAAREPPTARLEIPDGVLAVLAEAVRSWGDVTLAVRSSAVHEDLADFSYAGLYTSVLHVRGIAALREAVLRCWTSAFDDRVTAYARGMDENAGPAMAVLVQPMVPATSAGVAFTAHPVTGERAVVVIDAVPGLADRMVAGDTTPERWTIRAGRASREPGPGDTAATGPAALDAASALAVANMARRVERLLGTPQDVEWALASGDVVLLQARPITALPEVAVAPVPVPVEVPPGYWTRESSHAPLPWTRLTHAVYQTRIPAFRAAVGELGLLIDGLDLRDIGGLEYFRVVPLGGKEPPRLPGWAVPLAFRLVPALRRRVRECVAAIRADVPMRHIHRWTRDRRCGSRGPHRRSARRRPRRA